MSFTTLLTLPQSLPHALGAFWLLLAGFTAKFLFLGMLQGARRMRTRTFRWPEDAAHWGGQVSAEEDPLCTRAQAALRNDSETQPLFLAAFALWLVVGAPQPWTFVVAGGYLALRFLHTALLLWPRQPLRNRVFGLGLALLIFVLVDSLRRLW